MPRILISGCNTERGLQQFNCNIELVFHSKVYRTKRAQMMTSAIEADISKVIEKYYERKNK